MSAHPLPSKIFRLRQPALYAAFALACFLVFFALLFPYEVLQERLSAEAASQGYHLRIDHSGPAFFGVRFKKVEITRALDDSETKAPEPLRIDSLTLRPSIFPLGFSGSATLLGGELKGVVGSGADTSLKLAFADLDLSAAGFEALTGVQAAGKLAGEVDIRAPGRIPTVDLSRAQGSVTLKGEQVSVLGGSITVPLYGTLTPVDLPKAGFGDLDADIRLENGTGTVQQFGTRGGELLFEGSGTVRLDRQLMRSQLNLALKLKLEPDLQKRLGILASGLTILPQDPTQPGWRTARVAGLLGNPQFAAGK